MLGNLPFGDIFRKPVGKTSEAYYEFNKEEKKTRKSKISITPILNWIRFILNYSWNPLMFIKPFLCKYAFSLLNIKLSNSIVLQLNNENIKTWFIEFVIYKLLRLLGTILTFILNARIIFVIVLYDLFMNILLFLNI